MTVLTHTKIRLVKKEAKSKEFLIDVQTTLTTLPLSKRYQHLHFLKEKDLIKKAKDIEEIFDILDPYWNYVDYAFLEFIIKEFGTSKLKEEMEKYIAELEQFEKRTTVQDFNLATLEKRSIPNSFTSLTLKLFKDPAKCTLYEVCQLKIDVVNRSTLNGFTVYFEKVICNSVEIVLAFPPEAHTELLEVFDADFIATNNIVSMVFSYRESSEDTTSTTPVKGRQRKTWSRVIDDLFVFLGLDKAKWLEDIERGESSLASCSCIDECISERECRKFEEGLDNIVKLAIYKKSLGRG